MATIGRNAAVAELNFGFRSTGFIAWIMWLVLHLMQLVGFRNRLNVLMNWAWNYFTYDRSARLIMPIYESETLPDTHPVVAEDDLLSRIEISRTSFLCKRPFSFYNPKMPRLFLLKAPVFCVFGYNFAWGFSFTFSWPGYSSSRLLKKLYRTTLFPGPVL